MKNDYTPLLMREFPQLILESCFLNTSRSNNPKTVKIRQHAFDEEKAKTTKAIKKYILYIYDHTQKTPDKNVDVSDL